MKDFTTDLYELADFIESYRNIKNILSTEAMLCIDTEDCNDITLTDSDTPRINLDMILRESLEKKLEEIEATINSYEYTYEQKENCISIDKELEDRLFSICDLAEKYAKTFELINENNNGCSYMITAGFGDSVIADEEEQNIITEFLRRKLIKIESQINEYEYTMSNFYQK